MKPNGTRWVGAPLASIVGLLGAAVLFSCPTPTAMADWTQAKKTIPAVLLSDQHRALCAIGVGDQMPGAELKQLGEKETKLGEHYGKNATVVYIFKTDQRMSRTGLADMETDVASEFGSQGVNVVAIAEEGSTEAVRELVTDTKASFPVLLDPQGKFFAMVGTKKLPRVYVLDPEGKVLWFDIEYSQTTRRELRQAIGSRFLKDSLP